MTVIENVDIVLEVIDARDPIGTRTVEIEESLVKENKIIIIVMAKIGNYFFFNKFNLLKY